MKNNDYKIFTSRVGLIALSHFIIEVGGILLLPVLTRNMEIEDYATWVQINVTLGLLPQLILLGLPFAMIRFLPSKENKWEKKEGFYSIFFVVASLSAFSGIILFSISGNISKILFAGKNFIGYLFPLLFFISCLKAVTITYFKTFNQIKKFSFFNILDSLLKLSLVIYLVLSGFGIIGAIYGLLISSIICFSTEIVCIIREIGISIPDFSNIKDYLEYSIPTIPGNLSSWVVKSSDRYLIAIFLGSAFVGYYSPGYSLGYIIIMFLMPVDKILTPTLSKYYDFEDIEKVKTIMSYSAKYFLMMAIPSVVGISLLSKPILLILSNPEIAESSYLVTPFVASSTLLFGFFAILAKTFNLKKKTKISGALWIVAAIVNFGLNFYFVPVFGIIGAAITTLIAFMIVFVFTIYFSLRYLRFNLNSIFVLKSFLASSIMAIPILYFNPLDLISIIVIVLLCSLLYFSALFSMKSFSMGEIQFFKNIIKIQSINNKIKEIIHYSRDN